MRSNVDFIWEHPITSLDYVLYEKEEKEKLWKSWVYYAVLKEEKEENLTGWAWFRSGQVWAGDYFLMKLPLGLEGDSITQLDHSVI